MFVIKLFGQVFNDRAVSIDGSYEGEERETMLKQRLGMIFNTGALKEASGLNHLDSLARANVVESSGSFQESISLVVHSP